MQVKDRIQQAIAQLEQTFRNPAIADVVVVVVAVVVVVRLVIIIVSDIITAIVSSIIAVIAVVINFDCCQCHHGHN